jgi:hypothetical protein
VEGSEAVRVRSGAFIGGALALLAVFVVGLFVLMGTTTFDTWGAMFVAPILIAASVPILVRQGNREGDRRVLWLLVIALFLKLTGAVVRYYFAFDVYGGVADAGLYHDEGVELADRFRSGNFDTSDLQPLTALNSMRLITGIVYTIIGPTKLGGFLVFSWLGFWGLYFFYRAFTVAVPEGRRLTYGRLVFLLPSLLFWPSSIGKEAWMMFSLGIAAYGAARVLSGHIARGLTGLGLGLWLANLLRPHVAALIAVSLAAAYLLRRPRRDLGQLAPVAKGLGVALVAIVALIVVLKADQFLRDQGVNTDQGVTSALYEVSARTVQGGSEFVPSILESPLRAPIAVVTVLFRPLVFEAHNAQALIAALETTFLFLFSLGRIRWAVWSLRTVRRQPYVALAIVFTGLFIVAFSTFANFGLLARERVQVFPLYLVLFSIPPPDKKRDLDALPTEDDAEAPAAS